MTLSLSPKSFVEEPEPYSEAPAAKKATMMPMTGCALVQGTEEGLATLLLLNVSTLADLLRLIAQSDTLKLDAGDIPRNVHTCVGKVLCIKP